jgi:hypothetical protein
VTAAPRDPGWRFNVARLAELDAAFLGPRVIAGEFALGVAGCMALGCAMLLYTLRAHGSFLSWPSLLGAELIAIAANYVPLLFAALRVANDRSPVVAARRLSRRTRARRGRTGAVKRGSWLPAP